MNIAERQEYVKLWNGQEHLSIIHLSDIHLWYSTSILTELAAIIAKYHPDLIILTGDYYDTPKGAHLFRAFLIEVAQKHPVVFILGNHDIIYGSKISGLLSGIPNCICVEHFVFCYQSKRGHMYNITAWKNKHHLPRRTNEVNIVLIHNPEKIQAHELSGIDLILAGHLHGGQFIFFKTKSNAHFPGSILYKHCTDRKQIMNTTLIVSRGLGDTFPFRWNCPKEIVRITIE